MATDCPCIHAARAMLLAAGVLKARSRRHADLIETELKALGLSYRRDGNSLEVEPPDDRDAAWEANCRIREEEREEGWTT